MQKKNLFENRKKIKECFLFPKLKNERNEVTIILVV